MVAAALIGSSVIGAGANIIGSQTAASAQKDAVNQANANLQPYNQAGYGALTGLNGLTSGNPQAALEQLPGYKFTLDQGLKSVQNGYAARGLGVSGASLKGAANYATGLADQTYGNQFNRLMSLASLGENAGAGVGNNLIGAGNAQAAANIATGNAVGNAGSGLSNTLLINQLLQRNGGQGLFGTVSNATMTNQAAGDVATNPNF